MARLHYAVNGIHTVTQRFCDGLYTVMTRFGRLNIYISTPAE